MFHKIHKTISLALGLCVLFGVLSCKKDGPTDKPDDPAEKQYGALLMIGAWPNTAYYLVEVASLKEGKVGLSGTGVNMSTLIGDQGLIQRAGYYYYFNPTSGRLGRYHIENDQLVTDKEIPFTQMGSISSHVWVDDQTLVLFGENGDRNIGQYAILNVANMQITDHGDLDLPSSGNPKYHYVGIGFAEYRAGKIFLGFGWSADWPDTPLPKVLVAAIDYPSMAISKVSEDDRSTWPGGPTRYTPTSFIDENGDLYFATVPDNGSDYDAGSALYRIRSGSDEIDPNYYVDFSSQSDGHTVQAMWYIGNGQAIARVRIPADRSEPDFYYSWDCYFSVVDVHTGKVVKKLDLPTDVGEIFVQAVIVEDGKAYIMVNDANAPGYVWEYDPATGQLTKGLEFDAGYDFLLRIDKWN